MKISEERRFITIMITEFCSRRHHYDGPGDLCPDCRDLLNYAHDRLSHCPYSNEKTSCRKCVIHCYAPSYRTSIREVMTYIGPRMIYLHPIMAWKHFRHNSRLK